MGGQLGGAISFMGMTGLLGVMMAVWVIGIAGVSQEISYKTACIGMAISVVVFVGGLFL